MKRSDWFIEINPRIDDFRKKIWENVQGSKKVKYAWDMVIEAMLIKKTPEKLKFRKIMRAPAPL